ncbi:MAG TPA: ABC transporter permease [Candidatus Acidoferrales bacterium]|jgi:putative ABC transport system permease protein|nr:ABC transporter permease [Candidatus Acidoferrales bacterium]
MNPREVLRIAMRSLARNKMRTALTMLGIVIGVGAVICTVAIGEGASDQVQQQIAALGDNLIYINAGSINQMGVHLGSAATKTLTVDDSKAIQENISTVSRVSPGVNSGVQVVYQNQNWFTRASGVGPDYLQIRHWPLVRGTAFGQHDVDTAADVCLMGQTVAANLFGNEDPVGKTIRVSNLPFQVIGLLTSKGQSAAFGNDEDDTLIMPYSTVQKKISGISWIQNMAVSAVSQDVMDAAQKQIEALLRQRHHLRSDADDDFIIRSPSDLAQAREATVRVMELLLGAIASVSLVVGGIGIMNIMLVSVTERTREIGVRIAVGATELDVQRQFLSEAVVLSMFGGAIGVVFGFVAANLVSTALQWPTTIPLSAVGIAVAFSAIVGVTFGYYPAKKAASLDPIEALRYE